MSTYIKQIFNFVLLISKENRNFSQAHKNHIIINTIKQANWHMKQNEFNKSNSIKRETNFVLEIKTPKSNLKKNNNREIHSRKKGPED